MKSLFLNTNIWASYSQIRCFHPIIALIVLQPLLVSITWPFVSPLLGSLQYISVLFVIHFTIVAFMSLITHFVSIHSFCFLNELPLWWLQELHGFLCDLYKEIQQRLLHWKNLAWWCRYISTDKKITIVSTNRWW